MFVAGAGPVLPAGGTVQIVGGHGSVIGEVVTGKPYSAESLTESTQTLADGNRIVHTNRARLHRDSAGRTRREQSLSGLGLWNAGPEPVTVTVIDDPVAQVSYVLDARAQTARAVKPFRFELSRTEPPAGAEPQDFIVATRPTAAGVVVHDDGAPSVFTRRLERALPPPSGEPGTFELPAPPFVPPPGLPPPRGAFRTPFTTASPDLGTPVEIVDLGEQIIEGVLTRGTRETRTIPIGAIGNERPIEIVVEQWHSDELGALMSRRTYDPRFGETLYRLVGVTRGEPSPDLFTVPSNYRLVEEVPPFAGAAVPSVPGERAERRVLSIQLDSQR